MNDAAIVVGFGAAKKRIYVEETDQYPRRCLKIYCAVVLRTELNDFLYALILYPVAFFDCRDLLG
jgi:hypothetical protein